MTLKYFLPVAVLSVAAVSHGAAAAVTPAFAFVSPAGWSVGAPFSTSQEWAASAGDKIDGVPNVNFDDAGAGVTSPTLATGHTGFVASSGGFYSFSDWYSITAALHTASAVPAGSGTHVVVQTFASINADDGNGGAGSVLDLVLTTPAGDPLVGAVHLRSDRYGQEQNYASPFGPVDVQATIDEFWIPNFTGDFNAQLKEIIHSSFMGIRIDTIAVAPAGAGGSPVAPTPVPEPASVGVVGVLLGLLVWRRRRGAY